MSEDDGASAATRREGPGAAAPKLPKGAARGERIGRYVVEDLLGEGGMGVVYSAIDPELARKVAIKLVRRGGDSESQARLLREAQAMARLAHPNVVAIHDVGTYEGGVFLAMELVPGETVRRWLKREPRSWRAVLELFRGAGRGLAAAHAAGVIHRDFKLDNVLIDGEGRARVTDFGLARALEGAADDPAPPPSPGESPDLLDSPLTAAGAVVGTPAYMAPEQRSASASPDARTDEFSFCVSLYEALYGERPFAKDGALREPPAGTRVPRWLRTTLVRGLSETPGARWPSMAELLAALGRDPGARRRRIAVAGGALAVLGVAATALVLVRRGAGEPGCDEVTAAAFADTWNAAHANALHAGFVKTGNGDADRVAAKVAANLDAFTAAWKAASVDACRATRERREQPAEAMHLRMACLERQRVGLASLLELLAAPDTKVIELAVQASGSLPRPAECADVQAFERTARPPSDPAMRLEIESMRAGLASAIALANVGKTKDAIARLEPLAARAKVLGYRPLEAEADFALGDAERAQGSFTEEEVAYKAAAFAAEAGGADRVAVRACDLMTGTLALLDKLEPAKSWLERSDAILERIGGGDPLLRAGHDFARGTLAKQSGRAEEGIGYMLRALAAQNELLGPDHTDTLLTRANLGAYYDELAMAKEAIAYDSAAIAGFEQVLGPEHPRLIVVLANLALVHMRVGELTDAEPLLARAAAIAVKVGPKTRRGGIVLMFQAQLRLEQGRGADALALARDASDVFTASTGEKSDLSGNALDIQGAALLALDKPREAAEALERGIAVRLAVSAEIIGITDDLTVLAEAKLALAKPAEALSAAERALAMSEHHPRYPGELARTRFAAARALVASGGDRARALELAKQARDELAPLPFRAAMLAKVDAFLAACSTRSPVCRPG